MGDAPQVIVNAKVYPQVTGWAGIRGLAAVCEEVGEEAGVVIGLAPPQVELATVARLELDHVAVYAQHVDPLKPGSGTGHTTVEGVVGAGAIGSLLNHAEHKLQHVDVVAAVERLTAAGLQSLVCADGDAEVTALAPARPTFMAVEPPELIGGNVSVTTADPSIVERNAAKIREISPDTLPLCGAGVKSGADVAKALELGAYGVLLASGVVCHDKPLMALRDLVGGL